MHIGRRKELYEALHVTGEVVQSYLPVERQFDFAQKIIAAVGSNSELTAIKLRERLA